MRAQINIVSLGLDDMLISGERIWQQAAARTMNRAMAGLRRDVARDVSNEQKVKPQRLITRRAQIDRAKQGRLTARIRVLSTAIPAIRLSGVRDTRGTTRRTLTPSQLRAAQGRGRRRGKGVRAAGGHSWPTAFIAKSRTGHKHVFRRKGKARLPIEIIRIPIEDPTERAIDRRLIEARDRVIHDLPRELMYRMQKLEGA